MNIVSQFNDFLLNNFNKYLKNYFSECYYYTKSSDFNNYHSFINDIDNFSDSFIKDVIKGYFEYIDDVFFNSSYRKTYCTSNGFYTRKNYVTLFGEITFKRRYYFDKLNNEWFFFTDLFLGLPKRKHFDPFVCADICDYSTSNSYSKAGKLISNKIGKRTKNTINISRATARNIVMAMNADIELQKDEKRIERLFVMLDEKFVGSQFNDGNDHMVKASVVFEDTELEYKTKKKENSMDRYRLVNSHVCASIDNNLLNDTIHYIYNTYDTDYIKEIIFMGDCATWIKNFPKSHWFNFSSDTKVMFSMDGFHFSQALNNLTTIKYPEIKDALQQLVKENNKENFIELCEQFKDLNPARSETIEKKMNYILNNWNERQLYQNNSYMKCSMESHISHVLADIFTSRPKAYSKKGLRQLLKLRILKINKIDIKELYFQNINTHRINIKKKQLANQENKRNNNYNIPQENKYDIQYETALEIKFHNLKEIIPI